MSSPLKFIFLPNRGSQCATSVKPMQIAVEKGNQTRPGIKLGICGEHGGDPESVKFCHRAGLTYVSCSPFRVPVARLAAAQAALEEEAAKKARKAKK